MFPPLDGLLLLNASNEPRQNTTSNNSTEHGCSIGMKPPPGKVLRIHFRHHEQCWSRCRFSFSGYQDGDGWATDFLYYINIFFAWQSWNKIGYSSPGQTVWYNLWLDDLRAEALPVFAVDLNWINESAIPGLEQNFTSNSAGFVQTQGFNGRTVFSFSIRAHWSQITVAPFKFVMFSFAFIRCTGGYSVRVLLGDTHTSISACVNQNFVRPWVWETHVLHVRFEKEETISANRVFREGFKLLFSLHNDSDRPQQLADGRWNCSVPHWPQFQQHLPCNLHADCDDGRDEDDCPYSSEACGRGFFAVGSKCCVLVSAASISWNEADLECRLRGGRLLNFHTPQDWQVLKHFRGHVGYMYIGLRTTPVTFPPIYRKTWQHSDDSIVYYLHALSTYAYRRPACVLLSIFNKGNIEVEEDLSGCSYRIMAHYACEMGSPGQTQGQSASHQKVEISAINTLTQSMPNSSDYVVCPLGHVTHSFLSCDPLTACWGERYTCSLPQSPLPPSFDCVNTLQSIPYTLVCDFRPDCSDNSDEQFCVHVPCDWKRHYECRSGQCIDRKLVCDDADNCLDGSDEVSCTMPHLLAGVQTPWPTLVQFSGTQDVRIIHLNVTFSLGDKLECPAAHFQCPGRGYCLPVFTRCNGVYDCPGRQDEADCDGFTCLDLYRCRGSQLCLTAVEMCDGVPHCPQHDDELLCDPVCPEGCTCYGHAFFCHAVFPAEQFPELRFLDAGDSGLRPVDVSNNSMLVYLNLTGCGLRELSHLTLPNLHILHLSDNYLSEVTGSHLSHLSNLKHLSLAGNPLMSVFAKQSTPAVKVSSLHTLDLSRVRMPEFRMSSLASFPSIRTLNLSGCGVDTLSTVDVQTPASWHVLDVRGCPLSYFPDDFLRELQSLQRVMADNYKLCCSQTLPPGFNLADCQAPSDEVSSCDNLLRSHIYRVFLALFAALALLGNLTAFVARVLLGKTKNGFEVFVVTLCVSDCLMGVYLAIIGVADRLYLGSYLWSDVSWRRSVACKVAGFLCMTSNEVSALVVCLITLDRLLVLRFPFSRVRFGKKSGALASGMVWVVGVVLALVPLLPPTAHWGFYSLNGICMPLPITRKEFPGHHYSFSLLIVLNLVLFLLIAVGQLFIYLSVQRNSMQHADSLSKRSSRDHRLARRLITIAMSDFLCWFPIGLLGILSSTGHPVSGEVNVAMAIFVLPLNSAINPFLYTVNRLLERRQMAREKRLVELLSAQIKQRATSTAQNIAAD